MTNFKPGDWVHIPSLNTEPVQYRSDLCHLGLELWKPTVGEWCWFYSDGLLSPNIMQFSCMGKDGKTYLSGFAGYDYCEPFIGQLPTILKDNS